MSDSSLRRILENFRSGLLLLFCVCAASGHESTRARYEASLDLSSFNDLQVAASTLRIAPEAPPVGVGLCRLRIDLVDAATGAPLSGLVRARNEAGEMVRLPGMMNRGVMLPKGNHGDEWYAYIEPVEVEVPRAKLQLEAVGGLETERAVWDIDLRHREKADAVLAVRRFYDPAADGWHSGNTHLHLERLTRAQADDYLQTIPRADGLELVFVSYLERATENHLYISNSYTADQLHALGGPDVLFGWGEEHRHNRFPRGDGYGHVMLLNISRLVHPVSFGRNLMNEGPEYPTLRRGIDAAREDGATIIWCHNANGHEDLPNFFSDRIDALNIFDSGPTGFFTGLTLRDLIQVEGLGHCRVGA